MLLKGPVLGLNNKVHAFNAQDLSLISLVLQTNRGQWDSTGKGTCVACSWPRYTTWFHWVCQISAWRCLNTTSDPNDLLTSDTSGPYQYCVLWPSCRTTSLIGWELSGAAPGPLSISLDTSQNKLIRDILIILKLLNAKSLDCQMSLFDFGTWQINRKKKSNSTVDR